MSWLKTVFSSYCLVAFTLSASADENSLSTILTLEQAAALLQFSPDELAEAAALGQVAGGRQILGKWRFRRSALLGAFERPEPVDKTSAKAEDVANLLDVRGRSDVAGTEESDDVSGAIDAEPDRQESIDDQEPADDEFGEDPELGTARDVSLREQDLLLGRKQLTVEPSFAYSRTDNNLGLGTSQKREAQSYAVALRYGITDDVQISTNLPPYVRSETSVLSFGGDDFETTDSDFGDFRLSALFKGAGETPSSPSVNWSASVALPTDDSGAIRYGGGVSLVKSIDPTAIFANANYVHTRNASDIGSAANALVLSSGFSFAMNDRLSFGSALNATFPWSAANTIAGDETYDMTFFLTSLINEDLYVEPSISFRLNGPQDALTFALSFPYSIDITGLP